MRPTLSARAHITTDTIGVAPSADNIPVYVRVEPDVWLQAWNESTRCWEAYPALAVDVPILLASGMRHDTGKS